MARSSIQSTLNVNTLSLTLAASTIDHPGHPTHPQVGRSSSSPYNCHTEETTINGWQKGIKWLDHHRSTIPCLTIKKEGELSCQTETGEMGNVGAGRKEGNDEQCFSFIEINWYAQEWSSTIDYFHSTLWLMAIVWCNKTEWVNVVQVLLTLLLLLLMTHPPDFDGIKMPMFFFFFLYKAFYNDVDDGLSTSWCAEATRAAADWSLGARHFTRRKRFPPPPRPFD